MQTLHSIVIREYRITKSLEYCRVIVDSLDYVLVVRIQNKYDIDRFDCQLASFIYTFSLLIPI